ncbi:MAG: hypothetical protein ACYCQK_03320 [Acidiferrobacteraceae bacterium]
MKIPLEQQARLIIAETFARKRFVIVTFLATLAVAIITGLLWPTRYVSSATIVVDNQALMMPLARGQLPPRGVLDQAAVAQHMVRSGRIVHRAMAFAGWLKGNPSAQMQQRLVAKVRKHITVTDAGRNLIKISYSDSSRHRAYLMTERLTQLFLSETGDMRARENSAAYQFINTEVHRYRKKIATESGELAKLRSGQSMAGPQGMGEGGSLLHLQAQRDTAAMELQEARSERAALERQLHGQQTEDKQTGRIDGLRQQLGAYRAELAKLELSYQSRYPEIVILKQRIAAVKKRLRAVQQSAPVGPKGAPVFASEASADRYYQGVQRALSATNTRIAVLKARIQESDRLLKGAQSASAAVYHGRTVSQLLRNYAIDVKTLNGLLKRRENARLAMNMGGVQNDVSFHVAAPAFLPLNPAGPPFGVFVLAGLVGGLLLPFALVQLRAQLDQRVRYSGVISGRLNLPVIATVPHLATPAEVAESRRSMQWLGILVASTVFIVVGILLSGSMT